MGDSILQKRSIAIVGSGVSLRGRHYGMAIDKHEVVARFNDFVEHNLFAPDTGEKTTVHVTNHGISPLPGSSVAQFDMEWVHPWSSYCGRMHSMGRFVNMTNGTFFLIRPSAYCSLGEGLSDFTRGFLFYWFIGRLFEDIDMYGFTGVHH